MKKKLKILITGPIAPPAGGISIHIQRLTHLLKDEFNIDLIDESHVKKAGIFYMRSLNPISYIKKVLRTDILFIQGGNKLFKTIHILTGKLLSRKVIITIHGYGKRRSQPFRAIDSFFFSMANKIVLVNPDIFSKLPLPRKKCVLKHAFLPPVMKDEPELPSAVIAWLKKQRSAGKIIVCANASRLTLHNNEDLYGLDMCIETARQLIAKGEPVAFIYTVSALERGADLFNKNLQLINELGLQDHFMLISEKLSFVRLIENADIVIRPTNTDGDALTIREALYLGKPTIASDIVEKPASTILFRTRDNADLEKKLQDQITIIKNNATIPLGEPQIPVGDFKEFYTNLINTVALT